MRKVLAALAFVLAFVSLAFGQVPNGVVGVNYGGDPSVAAGTGTHGSGPYPNYSTFDRIYDANCSTTFHCTWWSTMQPSNTTPTWTGLDALLGALKSAGKVAEYTGSGVPSWVNSTQDLPTGPEQTEFQSFISAMFTHIAGNNECFGYYSIWNEVNQPSTYWAGTAATMATLAAGSHSAIKAACPNTVILSPSITAGVDSGSSPLSNGPFNYLDQFLSACNVGCIDGINIHGYPMGFFAQTAQPTNQLAPELIANAVTNAQALALKYGLPTAIYLDEGYAESDPSSTTVPANTPAYAAAQADQILLAASMGVSAYANSFYGDGCTNQTACGNEFANGRPLNLTFAGAAKRTVGSWLAGATFPNPIARTVGTNLITKLPNDSSAATGLLAGSGGSGCPSPPAGTGSLPSTWALSASASVAGGMSYYVVGKGTSAGIPYIDIRICGTDTSGNNSDLIRMDNFTAGATVGQQVSFSSAIGLAAGSLTGTQEFDLQVNEYTSAPAYNNQFGSLSQFQPVTIASASIGKQNYFLPYTIQGGATALAEPYVVVKHYGSIAIDITIRIANPIENVNATLWSGTMTKAGGYSALVAWNPVKGSVTAPSGSVDYRDVFGNVHVTSGGATIALNAGWPILIENAQQKAWVPVASAPPTFTGATWNGMIGAGGNVVGLSVANDNIPFVRADTGGAYYWNGAKWVQVLTNTSMPSSFVSPYIYPSAYEFVPAPSNSNDAYLSVNGYFLYSTNIKATNPIWTQSSLAQDMGAINTNGSGSDYGPHFGVDPANPSIVLAGLPKNGLFLSSNGGASFGARISSVALSSSVGVASGCMLVLYDPSSAVVGGATQGIYASSYGTGWYHSLDGGATWTLLSGTPTTSVSATISADGYIYAVSASGALSVWNGSAWSTPSLSTIRCTAPDPNTTGRVVAVKEAGGISVSLDHGATWTGFSSSGTQTLVSTDIPWLATSSNDYIDANYAWYIGTQLMVPGGVGVWTTTPGSTTPGTITYTSKSIGIEQLVANYIISPPGTGPIVASWDRPLFPVNPPGTLPSAYFPNTPSLSQGWRVEYAPQNSNVIAGLVNFGGDHSGISTDGLNTYTDFASQSPSNSNANNAGDLIPFDATHLFWVGSGNPNAFPKYSADGGASWSTPTGLPTTTYIANYYYNSHALAVDRVTPGVAYIYYYPLGTVYKTTNYGAAWTQVYSGGFTGNNIIGLMKSVPGNAGNLFLTGGTAGGGSLPANVPFYHSADGGATWSPIANVKEVLAFGFGKAYPGKTFPTVYINGWVSGVYGNWRNIDILGSGTWQQLGAFPNGNYDFVSAMEADINAFGWVYLGFHNTGYQFAYSNDAGPWVAAIAPKTGATVTGSSVTLTAVKALGIPVSSVTWKLDGVTIATGLSATWDSTTVAHGAHTLSVISTGNGQTSIFSIPLTTSWLKPSNDNGADFMDKAA